VQIIALDSSRAGHAHAGWLDEAQLDWLNTICTADDPRPLVVATHHHPIPIDVPWLDQLGLGNGQVMHEILLQARHRLRGVFFGHVHHSLDIYKDGILYSSVASAAYQFMAWPGQAQAALDMVADPGLNLVTVTAEQTFIRHHRFRLTD
jgi:3',5'-cyclic-AMP phosphodiesterase